MATVGKHPLTTDASTYQPEAKRARLFAPERDSDKPQPKVDPTYGQRGAFPGLDDYATDGEGALFYGPAGDGLEYLRMVRMEAKGVPNLLVAPSATRALERDTEANLYAPYKSKGEGWYSDGAYTAVPTTTTVKGEEVVEELDTQEVYYTVLLARFEDLRTTMATNGPLGLPANSDGLPFITRKLISEPTFRNWRSALLKASPTPRILYSLPQESVIQGIEVLETTLTLLNMKGEQEKRLGAWSWGLLGKCRNVGEMDSEDVSILRGFGKKAAALLRRARAVGSGTGWMDQEDEVGEAEDVSEEGEKEEKEEIDGDNEGPEGIAPVVALQNEHGVLSNDKRAGHETEIALDATPSLAEAQEALLSRLDLKVETTGIETDPKSPEQSEDVAEHVNDAQATLDMIVTIVGEFYGQRDLLDGRLVWEELLMG